MSRQGKLKISAETARRTARREQAIQREVDRTDAARKARGRTHEKSKAMQAGARAYPTSFEAPTPFQEPGGACVSPNPRRSGTRKHLFA